MNKRQQQTKRIDFKTDAHQLSIESWNDEIYGGGSVCNSNNKAKENNSFSIDNWTEFSIFCSFLFFRRRVSLILLETKKKIFKVQQFRAKFNTPL